MPAESDARCPRAPFVQSPELTGLVRRQYEKGLLNRRIVAHVEGLEEEFREITGESGATKLLCTCGRADCNELIVVPISAYEHVCVSPHQFVVAKQHAAEASEVVAECDIYDIVVIKPECRDSTPSTAGP